MPSSINTISPHRLFRLIGTPGCPALIDVQTEEDFAAAPRLIPGAIRRSWGTVLDWAARTEFRAGPAIVICQNGRKLSEGVAAWLRNAGIRAEILEGGALAWAKAGLPAVPAEKLPARDLQGRTVWVTSARPKIDRIACPWLIRRFVDPQAVFLFVAPPEVKDVAEGFDGAPFDIEGVFWSHRGERCTFDTMLEEWELTTPALLRLALMVRGADTARLDLVPEAAGLLTASLGLSRIYADDLEQLGAGLALYEGFYRWCRDAIDETHNWPTNKTGIPA